MPRGSLTAVSGAGRGGAERLWRRGRRRRSHCAGRGSGPPAFEPGHSRGGERGRGRRQAVTSEPPERIRWESRRRAAEQAREAPAISGCRQSSGHRTAPQLRTLCRGPPWRERTSSPNFSSGGSPGAAGHMRPRGSGQGQGRAAALRGVSAGAPLSSPPLLLGEGSRPLGAD